jgi:Transposase DDE domain
VPVIPVGPAKIIDWPSYNASLKRRGCVSLMLEVETEPSQTGRKGRPFTYSEAWIEAILLVGMTMRQPLRQLTGFMEDWLKSAGADISVPSAATLCERRQRMSRKRRLLWRGQAIQLAKALQSGEGAVICVDSTGLSIKGAGSWRGTRPWSTKDELKKHRAYTKLHLAMDPRTHRVVSYLPTSEGTADSTTLEALLRATGPPGTVATVVADGAYDTTSVYEALARHCVKEARIPPKEGAVLWDVEKPGAALRNNNFTLGTRSTDFTPGGLAWRKHTRYGIRSLVENTFSRLHALSTNRLRCRSEDGRLTEVDLLLRLLNRHADLGMPMRSHRVFP